MYLFLSAGTSQLALGRSSIYGFSSFTCSRKRVAKLITRQPANFVRREARENSKNAQKEGNSARHLGESFTLVDRLEQKIEVRSNLSNGRWNFFVSENWMGNCCSIRDGTVTFKYW